MRRIVLGKRGSDMGLWISKSGQDAETASGANLLLSTDENALVPFMSGTASISGTTPVSVSHGLGYVPVVLVYMNYRVLSTQAPPPIKCVVDSANITFSTTDSSMTSASFIYIIFRNNTADF